MRALHNRAARGTPEAFAFLPAKYAGGTGHTFLGSYAEIGDSRALHEILRRKEKEEGLPIYGLYAYTLTGENAPEGIFYGLSASGRAARSGA